MEELAYVGIDASITSTAVCIETELGEKYLCYHKGKLTKWHKIIAAVTEYHQLEYEKADDYSTLELIKLLQFMGLSGRIITDIIRLCEGYKVRVGMEGYSYASSAGDIVDLVGLGTLIRSRVIKLTQDFTIYSPPSMKLEAAKLVYEPTITGKKVLKYMYRNHQGIPGGSFKKPQMVLAMFEQERSHPLKTILLPYKDELLSLKNIPKPIDDIVDAYWAKEAKKYSNE